MKTPDAGTPGAVTPRARLYIVLLLLVAVGWGAYVRLHAIGRESAWCDEVLTLTHIPAPSLSAFLHDAFEQDPRLALSPLYYVLEYEWSAIAGDSLTSMRVLSVLLGLLCMVLLFAVARRLAGDRVALLAAWLLAMSLVHVYYAQEVRFYALLCVCALVSMWGLSGLLYRGGRGGWWLHGLGNVLMLWTHAFCLLFFAAQGLFLLLFRRRDGRLLLRWFLLQAAIGMAFAAWVLFLRYDFRTHSQAYSDVPPTLRTLANTFMVFAGGRFSNLNPASYLPGAFSLDHIIALAMLLLAAWAVLWSFINASARERETVGLLILWWLGPVLALFAVSLLWRPCYFDRYVLYSSFAWYILAAVGISRVRTCWLRWLMAAALLAALLYQDLAMPRPFRADYQSAARCIALDPNPRPVVHALKLFNTLGVQYSKPLSRDRITQFEGFDELCAGTETAAAEGHSVWVVFYRWERTSEFEARMGQARLGCERHAFGGMPGLTVYRVAR